MLPTNHDGRGLDCISIKSGHGLSPLFTTRIPLILLSFDKRGARVSSQPRFWHLTLALKIQWQEDRGYMDAFGLEHSPWWMVQGSTPAMFPVPRPNLSSPCSKGREDKPYSRCNSDLFRRRRGLTVEHPRSLLAIDSLLKWQEGRGKGWVIYCFHLVLTKSALSCSHSSNWLEQGFCKPKVPGSNPGGGLNQIM